MLSIVGTNVEFDLVHSAFYSGSFRRWMLQQAAFGTDPGSNRHSVVAQIPKPNSKAGGRHAASNVYGMNRYPACALFGFCGRGRLAPRVEQISLRLDATS